MVNDTPLTDDYVAELLKRDAKAVSSRAAAGLHGGISKRPVGSARPNTRFLHNILRDTSTHNAALLEREADEAKARLRRLEPERKRRPAQQIYSARDRHDRNSGNGGKPRERTPIRFGADVSCSKRLQSSRAAGKGTNDHSSDDLGEQGLHRPNKGDDQDQIEVQSGRASRRHGADRKRKHSPAWDESEIGPQPEALSSRGSTRGRGHWDTEASKIDAHFRTEYDPSFDVRLEDEVDDWDQALEALRDRQKFKERGAERLIAAGFTKDEVDRWRKGDRKEEEDVRWSKQGESREWDKGKDVKEREASPL